MCEEVLTSSQTRNKLPEGSNNCSYAVPAPAHLPVDFPIARTPARTKPEIPSSIGLSNGVTGASVASRSCWLESALSLLHDSAVDSPAPHVVQPVLGDADEAA